MRNFLITSTGRTATKWLATIMNKSSLWSVYHEPRGFKGDTYEAARRYFSRDYYGEVNGALIDDFYKVPYNKAIIRRDPHEIALSFANRYSEKEYYRRIKLLKQKNDMIRGFNAPLIEYSLMTSDLDYLRMLFVWFGIRDYVPQESDLNNVINQNKVVTYGSFNDLPQRFIDAYEKLNIKDIGK